MSSLADIARECGISTASVSYVLSGQGNKRRISAEMQQRILAAADRLGYSKRSAAAKRGDTKLGFFWPAKNLETTIANVVTGINSALQFETSPVEMSIFPYEYNALCNQAALWAPKSFDAAVILSPNSADVQALELRHTKMPAVIINRQLEGYSCITIDYEQVGRLAAEQAIARAGDDIALIRNVIPQLGMSHRAQAIYNVCRSCGVDLDKRIYYCDNSIDEAYELGVRILREKKLPRFFICVYDTAAFGLMRAFSEAGVRVGADVDILATSTSIPQFFSKCSPSLTVVDLKISEVSQRAVRMAIDMASQRLEQPATIVLPPEIIYRESSPIPSREQLQRLAEFKRRGLRDLQK